MDAIVSTIRNLSRRRICQVRSVPRLRVRISEVMPTTRLNRAESAASQGIQRASPIACTCSLQKADASIRPSWSTSV
eukprot:6189429-Pleurochrysis_carterae.AAC.1